MPYKLTLSTLGCPELSLEQALALAERHRMAGLELRSLAGTLDLPRFLADTYGQPGVLAERLRSHAVKVTALDSSYKLVGSTSADRTALLALVPWAEALGVPYIRIFDGALRTDGGGLAQAAATVAWWRELRARHAWHTDLMVETHEALLTAGSVKTLLKAIPGLAILWDSHHTWRLGGEDPLVTWSQLKPQIVHVHVKDSVSRPSASHPYSYVLPGTGEFPAAPILAALRKEFSGTVSLEWERLWHRDLPPVEEAITSAIAHGWP